MAVKMGKGPGRNKRRIIIIGLIVLLISAAAVFLLRRPFAGKTVSANRSAIEMGSAASLTLYADTGRLSETERKQQLSEEALRIFDIIGDLDQNVLSWRSEFSETAQFNRSTSTDPLEISPVLAKAISQSLQIAEAGDGAMGITLRPLIELWGIESYDGSEPYIPPSRELLTETAAIVGYEHLALDGSRLSKNIPELALDLGAIGKGYALDLAAEALGNSTISGAVLAVGGSIMTYGSKGDPWQIGIRDPEGSPADYMAVLSVPGSPKQTAFISTSGGYEKYVEADGIIYEHIIDGRTLQPAESDLFSVTVVTTVSGLLSDGLSTACYILGREASQPLLDRFGAEAIFVTREKTVYLTSGLEGQLSLTRPEYRIKSGNGNMK